LFGQKQLKNIAVSSNCGAKHKSNANMAIKDI